MRLNYADTTFETELCPTWVPSTQAGPEAELSKSKAWLNKCSKIKSPKSKLDFVLKYSPPNRAAVVQAVRN